MTRYIISLLLLVLGNQSYAQVDYSSSIPAPQLSAMKALEKKLRGTRFTLPKIIDDSGTPFSRADSLKYGAIFRLFFDTARIKLLKAPHTYYLSQDKEEAWLKGMTVNSVVGIHNLLHCLPDSLLFVMPASEYNVLDKEDGRVRNGADGLLVAGYKAGGYYYPVISILFDPAKQKIVYMNLLINFEGFHGPKKKVFEKHVEPILSKCSRTFSEDYGKKLNPPMKPNTDTMRVDNPPVQ